MAPPTSPSSVKTALDVAPTQEQKDWAAEVHTERQDGGGIRGKIANQVSKLFGKKKAPSQPEMSSSSNETLSTSASAPATASTSSRAYNNVSSNISQDQVIPGTSNKRMTRTQTAKASDSTAGDADLPAAVPKKSKQKALASSSKAEPKDNKGKEVGRAPASLPGPAGSTHKSPTIPPPNYKGPLIPPPKHNRPLIPPPNHNRPLIPPPNHNRPLIPPPTHRTPRGSEPISFYIGEESPKELNLEPEPRPLPANYHRLWNEYRAAGIMTDPPVVYEDSEKEETMKKQVDLIVLSYGPEERSHTEMNEASEEAEPVKASKAAKAAKAANTAKSPRPRLVIKNSDGDSSKPDKGKGKALDDGSEETAEASESDEMNLQSPVPTNPNAKLLKKIPPGHEVIDEGMHDRSRIMVGTPQPEALTLVFKTGKEDPNSPGVMQHLANVSYKYEKEEVDWSSGKFVTGLNKWRGQIFSRLLGKKMATRWKWTHDEMDVLCTILSIHLKSAEVGGSWTKIDWDTVTGVYNSHFEGVTQSAGELYARVKYNAKNGGIATSEPGKTMENDRAAPVRTPDGLKNQMLHFADQRAVDLVKKAKDRKTAEVPTYGEDHNSSKPVTPSKESFSPAWSEGTSLLKIVFVDSTKIPGHFNKRFRVKANHNDGDTDQNDSDSDQKPPPTKKIKLNRPAGHLRGGQMSGYNPNFNYTDDTPPTSDDQGREFPADSPFRLPEEDNEALATRAVRALAEAQRILNLDEASSDADAPPIVDRPTSHSNTKKRSRETDEGSEGTDVEAAPSRKKVMLNKRVPREDPFHNAPAGPSTAMENKQTSASRPKKRSRENEEVDDAWLSEPMDRAPSPKKAKVEKTQGRHTSSTLHQNAANVVDSEPDARESPYGWVTAANKAAKTKRRLPTLDDYLADN
ncbi:hypothetical protein NHQ30_007873 [Ciborinia camelliae]|nr:hypothetical protein NHQ30_007873 [Ciborinia camelliae]